MNTLKRIFFAAVPIMMISGSVNAVDQVKKIVYNCRKPGGVVVIPMAGGVMLELAGYKKAARATQEVSGAGAIASMLGFSREASMVAMGVDATLQGGTCALSDNETLQSIGSRIPAAQSKEGRAGYRIATGVAAAFIFDSFVSGAKASTDKVR